MRLTLRTLLAYLDNTLDKESAETLRGKITESVFASQLVQRIKASLTAASLGSPSPEAVGPIEDANAIGEYLDSTLPVEQVAEIERACLESEPLLAETAACHQILTLVLGKPAAVSPSLRDRIYRLPDSDAAKALTNRPTAESFASLSIPDEPTGFAHDPTAEGSMADAPISASMATEPRKPSMRPVGPSDSGVSDAPQRLRDADLADANTVERHSTGTPTVAGKRPRSSHLSELYAGSIRPSRITPWLVSLALAGVLLFALSRIFEPLLNQRLTNLEQDNIDYVDNIPSDQNDPPSASQLAENPLDPATKEVVVPAELAPPMSPVGEPVVSAKNPTVPAQASGSSTLPAPVDTSGAAIATSEEGMEPAGPQPNAGAPAATTETVAGKPAPALPPSSATPGNTPDVGVQASAARPGLPQPSTTTGSTPDVGVQASAAQPGLPQPSTTTENTAASATAVTDTPERSSEAMPPSSAELAAVPPAANVIVANAPDKPSVAAPGAEIAKLVSDKTLVTARTGPSEWVFVPSGGAIPLNTEIVCAPTFRARLEINDGLNVTMSGPTRIGFGREDSGLTMYMAGGRVLLRHKTPSTVVQIALSGRPISIKFGSADTIIAIHLEHRRQPGADPLIQTSRVLAATLMIVQGSAELTSSNMTNQLDTGQQWEIVGSSEPVQTVAKEIAEWIDEPDPNETSLEALARSGLLSMIDAKQPLELSLREAIPFRRAEVGALASRTLLWLGRGDVYFGGDGILNQSRQRAYWDDHYRALLAVVNQNVTAAEELHDSIGRMEAADRDRLFELLVGYSQEQLQAGADAKLVSLLDSPAMAVRVLALQNLRQITGTTLNYHADQDNAIRRATDVKKWEARARKGDIRWPVAANEAQ